MSVTFPADWKLSSTETVLLARLAQAHGIVSHADLDAVIAPNRTGKIGRPLKIHLHYLRRKLKPRGVEIVTCVGAGFMLSEKSVLVLTPFVTRESVAA